MTSTTIDSLANGDRRLLGVYRGCYAADLLSKADVRPPYCLLVNFGTSASPGKHWAAISCVRKDQVEIFDAFCLDLPHVISDWLFTNYTRVHSLQLPLAHPSALNCSKWCLLYCTRRLSSHASFDTIVSSLAREMRESGGVDTVFSREFYIE